MAVKIQIPTPLRPYTGQQGIVEIEGKTVGELLQNLAAKHGDLRAHLYAPDGKLRSFVNIYLNDEDIRFLQNLDTTIGDGDEISIVPAIAGG
jgi:MoaD family protein